MKLIEKCPLCFLYGDIFFRDSFFHCRECQGIFRPHGHFLPADLEKKRYLMHQNNVQDLHYQEFVSPITKAVLQEFSPQHAGLDFGAGSTAVISTLLTAKNYSVSAYDPYFFNFPNLLSQKYDYIACCEVIEHFYQPQAEFTLLKNLLNPGGILYCMTSIYHPTIDFSGWNYKNDPTHVFIYQAETLHWIKNHFQFSDISIDHRLIRFFNNPKNSSS